MAEQKLATEIGNVKGLEVKEVPFVNQERASREGQNFTHFISMECLPDNAWNKFKEKVQSLQDAAALVFPMGKRIKITSMHLTIATLRLVETEEVQEVRDRLPEITRRFADMVGAAHGLEITFQNVGWGDYGTIWAELQMGTYSILAYRKLLEDAFGSYITDCRFHPHLSVFKNVVATPEEKTRFRTANMGVTLAPIHLELITLREKKVAGEALKQPLANVVIKKDIA